MARISRSSARQRVRIIGGRWRGTQLLIEDSAMLRPTPNRIRETLFNWLQPQIEGARCVDLFAGSGALGIEALSRGAAEVVFVERDRKLAARLREQLQKLDDDSKIIIGTAEKAIASLPTEKFDVVFADPPFSVSAVDLLKGVERLLLPNGLLYLEQPITTGMPELTFGNWYRQSQAASVCFGLLQRSAKDEKGHD